MILGIKLCLLLLSLVDLTLTYYTFFLIKRSQGYLSSYDISREHNPIGRFIFNKFELKVVGYLILAFFSLTIFIILFIWYDVLGFGDIYLYYFYGILTGLFILTNFNHLFNILQEYEKEEAKYIDLTNKHNLRR